MVTRASRGRVPGGSSPSAHPRRDVSDQEGPRVAGDVAGDLSGAGSPSVVIRAQSMDLTVTETPTAAAPDATSEVPNGSAAPEQPAQPARTRFTRWLPIGLVALFVVM